MRSPSLGIAVCEPTLQQVHPDHSARNVLAHRAHRIQVFGLNGHHTIDGHQPVRRLQSDNAAAGAGTRIEPAVSVPKATSAMPPATATADPLEEPPGIRRRQKQNGFRGCLLYTSDAADER